MVNLLIDLLGIVAVLVAIFAIPTLVGWVLERYFGLKYRSTGGFGSFLDESDQKDEVLGYAVYDKGGRGSGG